MGACAVKRGAGAGLRGLGAQGGGASGGGRGKLGAARRRAGAPVEWRRRVDAHAGGVGVERGGRSAWGAMKS